MNKVAKRLCGLAVKGGWTGVRVCVCECCVRVEAKMMFIYIRRRDSSPFPHMD